MALVEFAPLAIADLDSIDAYLLRVAGAATSDKYAGRFDEVFSRLAAFPNSGAPRPRLGDHVRIVVIRPFVIIYRHDREVVSILRVVHGRRRITKRLLSQGEP